MRNTRNALFFSLEAINKMSSSDIYFGSISWIYDEETQEMKPEHQIGAWRVCMREVIGIGFCLLFQVHEGNGVYNTRFQMSPITTLSSSRTT